jgi:hypothetical protein
MLFHQKSMSVVPLLQVLSSSLHIDTVPDNDISVLRSSRGSTMQVRGAFTGWEARNRGSSLSPLTLVKITEGAKCRQS